MLTASAGAQLLPGVSLPPVSLPMPGPVGNVPVVGRAVQDILAQPQAQQRQEVVAQHEQQPQGRGQQKREQQEPGK